MTLLIEVLDGPDQGKKHLIETGLTIGRSRADILVDDPNISGLHAKIESNSQGQLFLIDQKSANGILLNGHKMTKLELSPGVSFQLGKTKFIVVTAEINELPPLEKPKEWKDRLYDGLQPLLDRDPLDSVVVNNKISAFNPPLTLEFIQGINYGKRVTLGYGPRLIGASTLDFDIDDPACPEQLCEFSFGPDCVLVTDLSQGKLLLNEQNISSEIVHDGDIISVGDTKIKLTFNY